MPQKVIFCKDCAKKTAEIEKGGAFDVVSCDPLPDQDHIPESERRCRIVWKPKAI